MAGWWLGKTGRVARPFSGAEFDTRLVSVHAPDTLTWAVDFIYRP